MESMRKKTEQWAQRAKMEGWDLYFLVRTLHHLQKRRRLLREHGYTLKNNQLRTLNYNINKVRQVVRCALEEVQSDPLRERKETFATLLEKKEEQQIMEEAGIFTND